MIDAGPVAPTALVTRTGGVPLAPAGAPWPCCASCSAPMQFLAQVVLDDLGDEVQGRGVLALFACQNDPGMCSDWEPDAGGNRALLLPVEGLEPMAQPEDGVDEAVLLLGSVRAVSLVHEDEPDYDQAGEEWAARNERPASTVLGQLGGTPAWIQDDETPSCPSCTSPMPLIAQLEEGPDHSTAMNFGSGGAYAFACEPCGTATFLWQC
ncbi:DUF1963 domain-containing protein [Streptacidiphilus sp. P02-A3a]|uniref:DUF1963 domain-containing protein n=1 Tax=Streptacidiphilus sp. P02-A3a TaxID=2704468 RepID=UPI0015F9AF14|nr:DUF1963 domain-containing protein [Streptacidiphilus sp. P02-A3a]QMU73542.1 DUF1963 domain-containing protein [Streptacidiphilus sp. P02-A3a]